MENNIETKKQQKQRIKQEKAFEKQKIKNEKQENKLKTKSQKQEVNLERLNSKQRNSNPFAIVAIIILALTVIVMGYFVYTLWFLDLTKSDTYFNYKIIATAVVSILFITLTTFNLIFSKKRKKIGVIILSSVLVLLNSAVGYGSIYINSLDGSLSIGKSTTYHGVIVALKDSEVNTVEDLTLHTVGLSPSSEDLLLNVIPKEQISEKVAYVTYVEEYASMYDLLEAVTNSEVDAVVLPYDYENQLKANANTKYDVSEYKVVYEFEVEKANNVEIVTVQPNEPFNVLFLGSDGGLTDVILLATIDQRTSNIVLTTVPRDSILYSDCMSYSYDKITHNGGVAPECVVSVVESTFNTTINYYMEVDFMGVIDIVNYLGGIWIDNPYTDPGMDGFMGQDENRVDDTVFIPAGLNLLNGQQALSFARDRYHSDSIQRSSNHIKVFEAMVTAMLEKVSFQNIPELVQVITENIIANTFPINDIDSMNNLASSFYTNPPVISGFTLDGAPGQYFSRYAGQNLSGVYPFVECQDAITILINKSMTSSTVVNSYSFDLLDNQKIELVTEQTNYYDVKSINGGPR